MTDIKLQSLQHKYFLAHIRIQVWNTDYFNYSRKLIIKNNAKVKIVRSEMTRHYLWALR